MAKGRNISAGRISDIHMEFSWYGDYCLTKRGSLIGAVELQGRDADGLIDADFSGLSLIANGFYGELTSDVIITQYFAHFDGAEISLMRRGNPVCDMLSKRRERFLNGKRLSSTKTVFCFEILPNEQLSRLNVLDLLKHAGRSIYSADSREVILRHFSKNASIICYLAELERQANLLSDHISDMVSDWEGLVNPRKLGRHELWGFFKFVSNFNPHYLSDGYETIVPDAHVDTALPDGDREQVVVNNVDAVKLHGEEAVYTRILSVNNFSTENVPFGLWAKNKTTPARQLGNYLLMVRYQPLSQAQKAFMFKKKEMDLNRRNIDLVRSVFGKDKNQTEKDRRELMKPAIKEALLDLGEAEMLDIGWGLAHSLIAIWDSDISRLGAQGIKIKRACDRAGLQTCWEGIGLKRAFKTVMPAGRAHSLRDIPFNTMQLGAASLLYAPSMGQHIVPDLPGEECQYIFMGVDGTPFYYSPFVNERCVVIGVGPIRSGKSFLKNTLASHFLKYGGSIHGIDVDQGMEPLAMVFGEDGGIFRSEESDDKGFNPFVSCRGPDDLDFANHLMQLVIQMVKLNDTEDMQSITADEQLSLDNAIRDTIHLNPELQSFNAVWRHCSRSLKLKLSRWVTDPDGNAGIYARYFDSHEDAIGSAADTRVMAYNLRSLKDNKRILPLIMAELFFRTIRHFEDINSLDVPNYLDVDEFHAMSKFDYIVDIIVRSVRTWGKYKGGVGLWSQSAKDFGDLPHWSALRSAASTFFFMADPNMDDDLYKEIFLLSDGECEAIRGLRPKREAYIVQRDIGISKKVVLEVEPEQHVISTSKATEAAVRRKNMQRYSDVEDAIAVTAHEIGLAEKPASACYDLDERVA